MKNIRIPFKLKGYMTFTLIIETSFSSFRFKSVLYMGDYQLWKILNDDNFCT